MNPIRMLILAACGSYFLKYQVSSLFNLSYLLNWQYDTWQIQILLGELGGETPFKFPGQRAVSERPPVDSEHKEHKQEEKSGEKEKKSQDACNLSFSSPDLFDLLFPSPLLPQAGLFLDFPKISLESQKQTILLSLQSKRYLG